MIKFLRVNDWLLLGLTLLVTGLGLVIIFDAGYARSIANGYGVVPKEFRSQILFLPLAILVSVLFARINPSWWQKAAPYLWVISLAGLLLPLVPGLGVEHNGAVRWFRIGPVEIQPAEFVKVSLIAFLASTFCLRGVWQKRLKPPKHLADALDTVYMPKVRRWLPAIWVAVAILLIEKEPDMGTSIIVAVIAFSMFVVGGVSGRSLILVGILSIIGIGVLTFQEPYRVSRIMNHWHRWDPKYMDDIGYQSVQSEIALASGFVVGVGAGAGRAKQVLSEPTNDFIWPTVGEEFGLVGSLVVLSVLGLLVLRLFQLAPRAPTQFGSMVLTGVGAWIGIQTCINVLMSNATLPAIGVPLPFISSGGSSLISLWMALGLCQAALSPAAQRVAEEVKKRAPHRNGWRHRRPRLSRA